MSKPLVWMVVADTVLFVALMLLLVFHVMPVRQVLFVFLPILFVLDALCVAYLLRRNRGGGNAP